MREPETSNGMSWGQSCLGKSRNHWLGGTHPAQSPEDLSEEEGRCWTLHHRQSFQSQTVAHNGKERWLPWDPDKHIIHSDTVAGHGDRVDVFLKCYLPNFCQVQLKRGRFCAQILFQGQLGKSESLIMTEDILSLEASFSYLELFRQQFPPAPTLHSHLSFSCANKIVHGLCQSIPMCRNYCSSCGRSCRCIKGLTYAT